MARVTRILVAVAFLTGCGRVPDPMPGFPRLVLWAWERPEDLRFVDPQSAGVAFLARTVSWRDGRTESRPRLQPLRVAPGARLIAVVRLESSGPPLPDVADIGAEIVKCASLRGVEAVQIDFDARSSERDWYRRLLDGLHAPVPVGITALASWCERDAWIAGLPVIEAVPMLFRMGPGEPRDARSIRAGLCRASFGISTDESVPELSRGRRLFVFNPRRWDADSYRAALRLSAKWR